MDSLVGYGSDDEVENDRFGGHYSSVDHSAAPGSSRRRDDDTNYDDVNMDMSEAGHVLPQDSQAESEPELPQAEPAPSKHAYRDDRIGSGDSRERDRSSRDRSSRDRNSRDHDRGRRDSPARDKDRSDRREPRRDDRYRSERSDRSRGLDSGPKRGLLGDRPDDKSTDSKVPALMDLKPFGGEAPPSFDRRSQDARDAVSPRFSERERDRREKDRERDRDREHRPSRRSEERRHKHPERRERSRSRGAGASYPPPASHSSSGPSERRSSPQSEYRPSYKVNKKLEVMEKMGLQIKTPSGSMATAQQLRAAANEPSPLPTGGLPSYYNSSAMNSAKILDQVNKRKLLWANKAKNEQEEAAKWTGTRFAQDNDGKQASKFMRLMGIKDPAAVKPEPDKQVDPIKKQEELFQAMQAQYEVARATTHTMRGVGLGFQRGQF